MTDWLRAQDCPLLHGQEPDVDAVRQVQRLLELTLLPGSGDRLAQAVLQEIAAQLRVEHTGVWEAAPAWQPRWQYARPGTRPNFAQVPRPLLHEVLDREAGTAKPPGPAGQPAVLAACLSYVDRPNRVLVAVRPREPFARHELEYAVAAGHYLGAALERARSADEVAERNERLHGLIEVGKQLTQERETIPLLEHIAAQAARLLRCERASIFLWDRGHKELVGRPALGMPGNELRLNETDGLVGQVVRSGEPRIVQDVQAEAGWSPTIDQSSGFRTRNLACVPMRDRAGQVFGALEVLNRTGAFTGEDIETLSVLAGQVALALEHVRELEALVRCHEQLDAQARLAARIIGDSPAIATLRKTVADVGRTELPVLILGESGTGKDVVARAIHYSSPRAKRAYVPVNCAAIAESLLESELFGHEKGAFTGADATRAGKFEAASGGTLFLDEIGEMSPGGQAKLLRVLEEKVVFRVGGTQPIPVDTRIVAATNRQLAEGVRAGTFRGDLYYRLTVMTIPLPPLRERREDVIVLAEHFLQQFCRAAGRKLLKISAEARRRLEQHDWPGNVRELRNLLERVAYLCPGERVEVADLAFILHPGTAEGRPYAELPLAEATDEFQREHIRSAIEKVRGNMSEAAKVLGLHRPNLYRKMKQLGMDTGP